MLVQYPIDSLGTRRFGRQCAELVEGLWLQGLRNFIVVGKAPTQLSEALSRRPWSVAAASRELVFDSNGLPPGPTAVWISPRKKMPMSFTVPRSVGFERLVLTYEGAEDPRRPGEPLADREHTHAFAFLLERLQR